MEVRLTISDPLRAGSGADVLVSAPSGTLMRDVRPLLLDAVGAEPSAELDIDGAPMGDQLALGDAPLIEAALLTISRPDAAPASPGRTALLELHVTAGPDAGQVHPLAPGRHHLGRSPAVDVTVADVDVSRVHARLDVSATGVHVHDEGSTNGTFLDGSPVGRDGAPLALESELRVGSSVLVLRLPDTTAAAVTRSGAGTVEVNRPPRAVQPLADVEVRLPARPEEPRPTPFPAVAVALPVLISVPMAFLWSPFALLFGLSAPVMMLANLLTDRRSGRRRYHVELAEYSSALSESQDRADAALAAERRVRERSSPDAASLLAIVSVPTPRLWERRPGDDDYLSVRLGRGSVQSRVTQLVPEPSTTSRARRLPVADVPVTLLLPRDGVIGVAGPPAPVDSLVRHLVAHLAALHTPLDVRVAVLTLKPQGAQTWRWGQWVPHLQHLRGERLMLAADAASAARLGEELRGILEAREVTEVRHGALPRNPSIVVVLDGTPELRELPGIAEILSRGPAVGIYTIATAGTQADLPGEAGATVDVTGEVGAGLEIRRRDHDVAFAVADLVSQSWVERFARHLGPLRDGSPRGRAAGVPDTSRLVDVIQRHTAVDPLDAGCVVLGWERRPRCTRAAIGEHADGVYAPDLSADGPHVLVGGTTGAGKSELLQSLICALAVTNRPDELVFLLIDYKGGAAFAECARLPHAVGLVTDLDEHLTRRALTSLTAEVRRRERILREAGAKDLDDYQRLAGASGAEPLPRLVIVVDEYRVLAEELPDFVSGLVRLAAVGRSLGLHLVLATQRPSGAVSPEIKANVNLRIALRVRDSADSVDVVESPKASRIDPRVPGRALSRSRSDELVEFQVARVGGRGPAAEKPGISVRRLTWRDRTDGLPRAVAETGPTDLALLVATLLAAARRVGAAPRAPWLPPLPDVIRYADAAALVPAPPSPTGLVIGIVDEPARMRQRPLVVDPGAEGGVAVVGGNRTGRTGTLLSLAAAAARTSPADVHLYVLGAGPELADLARMPHAGAVVAPGETERAARLLRRVAAEVVQRRGRGGRRGLPALLLLVDGWDAVQRELEDADGGALEHLLQVLRDGPSVGVMAVATGDRGLLTGRVGGLFGTRLLLRAADPTDLLLAGVQAKDVPRHMPPGRGVLVTGADPVEVQVCLADSLDALPVAGSHGELDPDRRPFRVPAMPERLPAAELLAYRGAAPAEVLLGAGGDDVRPLGVDLEECRSLLVAGAPGSGRSSALALLAAGLASAGWRPLLVCPRPSPARRLVPGGVEVLEARDTERLAAALASGSGGGSTVVLVDDAEGIEGTRTEDLLLGHLHDGSAGVVLAGGAAELGARFRGLAAEVRRARTGVLLSPTGYADGDVLGVSVARARAVRPGRGHLVRRGASEQIQLAVPDVPPGGQEAGGPPPGRSHTGAGHPEACAERVPHPSRRTW